MSTGTVSRPAAYERPRRVRTALMLASVVLAVLALGFGIVSKTPLEGAAAEPTARTLQFFEDFSGPAGGAVDPSRWTTQVGGGWNYGKDLQYYTPGTHNAALTGRGTLMISAREEPYSGSDGGVFHADDYTSARLISKASVDHGHVEARIRVDTEHGALPAFWLLGSRYDEVGWPASGEIDVMEALYGSTQVAGGLHGPQEIAGKPNYYWQGGAFDTADPAWMSAWHVYGLDWTPDRLTWTVDGVPFAEVARSDLPPGRTWAVDQPANIILNVSVGGYAGPPVENFRADMEIDWVRVSS